MPAKLKSILEELCEEREFIESRIQKLKEQLSELEERLGDLQIEIDEERSEPQEAA